MYSKVLKICQVDSSLTVVGMSCISPPEGRVVFSVSPTVDYISPEQKRGVGEGVGSST